MSYTITITFPQIDVNDDDTLQLIMTLTVETAGANEAYTSTAKNLLCTDYGSLSWQYDLEDTLLTPGILNLKLFDEQGYLDDLLFGTGATAQLVDKQFKVELKISGTTEFIGYAIEESIESTIKNQGASYSSFEIEFRAAARSDIINKTMIYDDDGLFLDPLGYSTEDVETISAISYASAECSITHSSNTNIDVGDSVRISNVVGMDDINGVREVTDDTDSTHTDVSYSTSNTYTSGGTLQKIADPNTYEPITDILEAIFQLVNPSISYAGGDIEFYHDWEFIAITGSDDINDATHSAGVVTVQTDSSGGLSPGDRIFIEDVVGMTDLNAEFSVNTVPDGTHFTVVLTTAQSYTSGGKWYKIGEAGDIEDVEVLIQNLFFDNTGPATVGELLKKLAIDFFSFTGMISEDRVFFKKLYRYDSGNTQTLGTVRTFRKEYRYPLIDYVKMKAIISAERIYEAGTFTNISNKILTRDPVIPSFFDDPTEAGTNMRFTAGSNNIFHAKDTAIDSAYNGWHANGYLLANLWYNFRGSFYTNRVDHFEVEGVGYDFLKDFQYGGNNYQIIGMTKRWKDNITEIDALFLGASS